MVQNSAIDSSSDDEDEAKKNDITVRTGTSIPSSASSMAARQAAEAACRTSVTRSCSSHAQRITESV